MPDFLLRNTPLAVSKQPEASFNTLKTAAADFSTAATEQLQLSLPELEKFVDENLVGNAGYATVHDNDYFSHPSLTMSDRLNTSNMAIYLARMLAGTITSTGVGGGTSAYDHKIEVLAMDQDPQIKSSTFAVGVGNLKLLLGGMVGQSFSVNFADANAPTFSAEFVGSGKFDTFANQTPQLSLPAYVVQNYMGSTAALECSFNDGTTLNLHQTGQFKGLSLTHNNNLQLNDRRPGDAFRTPADIQSGAYSGRLTRDIPSFSLQLQFYVGSDTRVWDDHLANTRIQDFKFTAKGRIIGATAHRHEVEFVVPQGVFRNLQVTPDRGKHVMTVTLSPELKTGEKGLFYARIRNTDASLA